VGRGLIATVPAVFTVLTPTAIWYNSFFIRLLAAASSLNVVSAAGHDLGHQAHGFF
jgi:hypothetical protein